MLKAKKGNKMFPEKGDRFMVEKLRHSGGSRDDSYQSFIFECTFRDEKHMVAKVIRPKKDSYIWCKVGTVVDFSTMTGEFVTVDDGYINALYSVPGNGFGFVRTEQMPKLVLVDEKLVYAGVSK
jgi:hypothetical protein